MEQHTPLINIFQLSHNHCPIKRRLLMHCYQAIFSSKVWTTDLKFLHCSGTQSSELTIFVKKTFLDGYDMREERPNVANAKFYWKQNLITFLTCWNVPKCSITFNNFLNSCVYNKNRLIIRSFNKLLPAVSIILNMEFHVVNLSYLKTFFPRRALII